MNRIHSEEMEYLDIKMPVLENMTCSNLREEHAYASSHVCENNMGLFGEYPIMKIKSELEMECIEIKQEETEYPELQHYDNMDTLNHVAFNSLSVETKEKDFTSESIPRQEYIVLQQKYKNDLEKLYTANAKIQLLEEENLKLKFKLSKINKQQHEVELQITEKSKSFYSDLEKMNEKHIELQKEIKILREKNTNYKAGLYISPKTSNALERNIRELMKKAENFVDLEKQTLINIKILQDELVEIGKGNTETKLKLVSTMRLLTVFQRRIAKQNADSSINSNLIVELFKSIKDIQNDHNSKLTDAAKEAIKSNLALKQAEELITQKNHNIMDLKLALGQAKELEAQMKGEMTTLNNNLKELKYTHKKLEVAVTKKDIEIVNLSKGLNVAKDCIVNKEQLLIKIKAELKALKSSSSEKEARHKLQYGRYNQLLETSEQKVKEKHQEALKFHQKLIDYKNFMSKKTFEIDLLKSNIKELENKIQILKSKNCDYCGL